MRRLLALLLLLPATPAVLAAESYDGCVGFIDSVPTVISTQGTWCLRKDLATSVTSGAAILINTNNVTIDCNGFKLGGLAAGPGSWTDGVFATGRLNATVRNCAIRGFMRGVSLQGTGGGHLVEDNRIDQSLSMGILLEGDGNLAQRNRIFDTGASGGDSFGGTGIGGQGDFRDNTIDGVIGEYTNGIVNNGDGAEIRGNRIRNLLGIDAQGIRLYGAQQSVIDNRIVGVASGDAPGYGIYGTANGAYCRDNLIANMSSGIGQCEDNGGNVVH